MSSAAPVVFITGANQGLGNQIADLLSQSSRPYSILVGARNASRGEEAVKKLLETKKNPETTISFIEIDLNSSDSISGAVSKVGEQFGKLDILVNNAAIAAAPNQSASSRSDLELIFGTNVIGTVEVTQAFLPLLEKSKEAKLVVMSSSMGSISMAESGPSNPFGLLVAPYRATKAAINMFVVMWSQYWGDKVKVYGVDPGFCATEFGGEYSRNNGRDPKEGAEIVRQCIEGEREDCIGKVVWEENGETGVRPW